MGDIMKVLGESPFALEHGDELDQHAQAQREVTGAIVQVNAELAADRVANNLYMVLVFKGNDDCVKCLQALELPLNQFQDGRNVHELLEPLRGQAP